MTRRPDGTVIAPPIKTEEQRQEEERERERERQQSSWLWNFIKDNWFLGLITLGAFWFFGSTPAGQKMWGGIKEFLGGLVDKIIDWLPLEDDTKRSAKLFVANLFGSDMREALEGMPLDEFQKRMAEPLGLTKEKFADFVKTDQDRKALLKLVADANETTQPDSSKKKGEIKSTTLASANTLYALMTSTQFSPLLMDVARASLAKAGQGQKLEGKSLEIVNSLRAIVGDEEKLNALLTTHRARTLDILKTALKPDAAATLEKLIDDGMEGGKATPALRTLLTSMLTPDSEGKLPGEPAIKKAVETYGKENPKAAVTLLDAFLATDEGRTFAGNNNGKAFAALQKHMGDKTNLAALLMTYQNLGSNKLAQMKFALDNRPAFDAYVENADLQSLPAAYRTPLEHLKMVPKEATATITGILGRGINPLPLRALVPSEGPMTASHLVNALLTNAPQRALIRQIGAEDVVKVAAAFAKEQKASLPAIITPQNLDAALKAADAIAASKTMTDEAGKRDSLLVVNAFVDMLMNENPAALSKLKAGELAKFMNEPANSNALKTLLQEVSGLSKQQDATRQVLIKHWDVISRLGADEKDGAEFLIDAINRANGSKQDIYSCQYPNQLDATTRAYIAWKGTSLFNENLVGKYAEEFKKLAIDLKGIACDNLPPITPPRPTAQAAVTSR